MLSGVEQRVCDWIRARDGVMREDLAAHVAIPTGHNHSEGLVAYRGLLRERLGALGASYEEVEGDSRPEWLGPGESSFVPPPTAVLRRGAEGKVRVLLAGHLDTVFPPDGPFTRMEVSSDGKTGVGPGVVDMKGGILIALNALEALEAAGVGVSWSFVLNSDEEVGSFCSAGALRREAAGHDVGLALEPALPGGGLAVRRKGSGQFCVEVRGRSAHAGREFEKGVSAVYGLGEVLTRLAGMSDLERGVTVNVGPIMGGTATNVVPDYAVAWGNTRYPDAEAADEVTRMLDGLVVGGGGSLPEVVVHRVMNRPAKPRTAGVEALASLAVGAAGSLGQELPLAETGGVCDGNILQDAGLATIDTVGVRGGGLHTHQEWIEMESLVERSCLLAVLMLRLTERGGLDGGAGVGATSEGG